MDISTQEQRRAFGMWLRTGRWPRPGRTYRIETKFNPWHDPTNGQFTSGGDGSWGGGGFTSGGGGRFGGGGASGSWPARSSIGQGGSFGGAGASGSWSTGESRSDALPSSRLADRLVPLGQAADASAKGPPAAASGEQSQRVVRNGYEYQIDGSGRTKEVSGTLTLSDTQSRSRTAQTQAGGEDRRPGDDGGHYIAARFNGPTDAFNHFAQDANFNRGGYRALEDQWASAAKSGKQVFVKITPTYDGSSRRPASLRVSYTVEGQYKAVNFPNERQEKLRGK